VRSAVSLFFIAGDRQIMASVGPTVNAKVEPVGSDLNLDLQMTGRLAISRAHIVHAYLI